ncbi:salicylate hydroxylase [Stagonosporopsis vannaccii]|nr:salicylate hydroxylase [Stagonosporopsis vannaccii]
MADQHFNVAIVGAGIGGLALAIGLSHRNIPFTIYESAPAFATVGAGVGLGTNALRAMDLIDKRFRDMYMGIATGNLMPEKKHVMMEAMRMEKGLGEGEGWWSHGEWGAPYFERTGAHRKDLLDIMTSFIDRDAVRFDRAVASIEEQHDQVILTFTDGLVATHAAVIGCDGIKGLTRRVVLGEQYPQHVEPQYTYKYAYRSVLPMENAKEILGHLATDAKMYMSKNSNLSTYPISEGKQMNVVAFRRDPEPWRHNENTQDVARKRMLEDFTDVELDGRLRKLLELIKPTRWAIFDHPNTPTYYNSLTCLLGDVAHASGPHQGAGAGQGLEDALILTCALGHVYDTTPFDTLNTASPDRTRAIKAAFQAYDEVRRPRAQKQVRTAQECGEVYNLRDAATGEDLSIEQALANLNGRFEWLWKHDLEGDIEIVEARTAELLRRVEQ